MTTNYSPGNLPPEPTGPGDVPNDAAWGCLWWWWLAALIIILIFWFGGWGWGPYGGYWFRRRPVAPQRPVPTTQSPTTRAAMTPDDFMKGFDHVQLSLATNLSAGGARAT